MKVFSILCISSIFSAHAAGDTINQTQSIRDGETLVSKGNIFALGFFHGGNGSSTENRYLGVWYTFSPDTVAWVANRESPVADSSGVLQLTSDGDLIIFQSQANLTNTTTNHVVWSSNSSNPTGNTNIVNPVAKLLDSGNLIVTNGVDGSLIWQTFDHPRDTLLPVMKLGVHNSSGNHKKTVMAIIISIVVAVFIVLILSLYKIYIWMRNKNKNKNKKERSFQRGIDEEIFDFYKDNRKWKEEITLFDYSMIASSTNNFSSCNKIGQGGFGSVYKGTLADGQEIAVKRLSNVSRQGFDEFLNEIVVISKLQHRNLVRLLGCCMEGKERMLVYEFMKNKSLDSIIFGENKHVLDWTKRVEIIIGIARGLLYIHQDSRYRIIHRDIKAGNVLLDEVMNPKISDFGTAKIFDAEQMEENTRKIIGTYGYMSPEYARNGTFSNKSDVFSFGVLLLEIISGRKNQAFYQYDLDYFNLLDMSWKLCEDGKDLELVDESLRCSCLMTSQVLRFIQIGLLCVQEFAEDRPGMCGVVMMLNSEDLPIPEAKRAAYTCRRSPNSKERQLHDTSSSKQTSCTINEMTFTQIYTR